MRDFAFGGWLPSATSIVIVDAEPVTEHEILYVIRAPGRPRTDVIAAARAALAGGVEGDASIVVKPLERNAARFSVISSGAVIIALWTGFLVIAVALAGSLALASFSVAERTRQIGVRRALGASRGEIVRYFLFENLLLTGFGLGLGIGLAVGFNHVLRRIMADLALIPAGGAAVDGDLHLHRPAVGARAGAAGGPDSSLGRDPNAVMMRIAPR